MEQTAHGTSACPTGRFTSYWELLPSSLSRKPSDMHHGAGGDDVPVESGPAAGSAACDGSVVNGGPHCGFRAANDPTSNKRLAIAAARFIAVSCSLRSALSCGVVSRSIAANIITATQATALTMFPQAIGAQGTTPFRNRIARYQRSVAIDIPTAKNGQASPTMPPVGLMRIGTTSIVAR